jgi:hypothetical protein
MALNARTGDFTVERYGFERLSNCQEVKDGDTKRNSSRKNILKKFEHARADLEFVNGLAA